jgi:hypothetical protein
MYLLHIYNKYLIVILPILFIITIFLIQEYKTRLRITKINTQILEKRTKEINQFHLQKEREQKLLKEAENSRKKEQYIKLADLYYSGIPDKYDLSGKKIKGVIPDHKKTIENLLNAYQLGDQGSLLKIAKIYHHGMFGLDPDLAKAETYYNRVLVEIYDNDLLIEAREGVRSVLEEKERESLYGWLNLPKPKKENKHHKEWISKQPKQPQPQRSIWSPNQQRTQISINSLFRASAPDIQEQQALFAQLDNSRRYRRATDKRPRIAVIPRRDGDPNFNDSHNVHNSQVLSTIKHSLNKLKEGTKIEKPTEKTIREIRSYIKSFPQSDKRDDALKSLDSIETSTSPLTFCKMKEVDALNLVWNRIHDQKHNKNRNNIKETLFNQLSEMIEHGKPVCSTGKFTRLIDTLNVVDEDVQIKPTYAINQEMMNKSANIRSKLLEEYGEGERKKLELGTSGFQDEYEEKLKKKIRDDLKRDYVDTGILGEEKFNNELGKWIDHI